MQLCSNLRFHGHWLQSKLQCQSSWPRDGGISPQSEHRPHGHSGEKKLDMSICEIYADSKTHLKYLPKNTLVTCMLPDEIYLI